MIIAALLAGASAALVHWAITSGVFNARAFFAIMFLVAVALISYDYFKQLPLPQIKIGS